MAIDIALLRVIKERKQFIKVYKFIPQAAVGKSTKQMVRDMFKYFKAHPEEQRINFSSFRSLFFTSYHKNLKEDEIENYNTLLDRMQTDVPEEVAKSLINQLIELEYATALANKVEQYHAGDDIDIMHETTALLKHAQEQYSKSDGHEYADLDDSAVDDDPDTGLDWCLPQLNEHYRKIQAGDQTIIAARPGVGKSTFLTFNNVAMAKQMPADTIIVWFNNESRRQRIMKRQIQSALQATEEELLQRKKAGTMNDDYIKVMGRKDKVRVYDIHGKNNVYLEEILESLVKQGIKIGAIVVDMLDNVKFAGMKDLRTDQQLEEMYKWLRELGVEYVCPTFPTSQVSNEGADLLYPLDHMLKDSKTGKQGACDNIIMIGKEDDDMAPTTRGISMPKTKTLRAGKSPLRDTIIIDGDRGVFK